MKKRLYLLLLVMNSISSLWAYESCEINGIRYKLKVDYEASVIGVSSRSENITIPSTFTHGNKTYTVNAIEGFSSSDNIKSVTIPNSVITIGDYAFQDCTGLTSINLSVNLKTIGAQAFCRCTNLRTITIPKYVTSIGRSAFYGCKNLSTVEWNAKNCEFCDFGEQLQKFTIGESVDTIRGSRNFTTLTTIVVDKNNPYYDSREDCNAIIKTATKTLICGCKNTIIPNSVTSIGDWAFGPCTGLTSITIPNSVTSIGYSAFNGCTDLTSITIPNSVTSIGWYTFSGCTGLTSVTIGNNVACIESCVFADCTSLTSIVIGNSVTSIEGSAFAGCIGLTSINLPNSVMSLKKYSFKGCDGLTSIIIPKSVLSIEGGAFASCNGLKSITVESGNSKYDSRENCNAIIETATHKLIQGCSKTTIPNNVTSIGEKAFEGCKNLASIDIPNSVTSIGEHAFYDCKGLTSITIPNSVRIIKSQAFYRVNNIAGDLLQGRDDFPWGAKCVNGCVEGYFVYKDSTKQKIIGCSTMATGEITIPNSVTNIGVEAFSDCIDITSVFIPNGVTSIENEAFSRCSKLAFISIPNTVQTLGKHAFWECIGLTSISIPNSVTSIGTDAFCNCTSLTKVTIGNSKSIGNFKTKIEKGAFYHCTNLNTVILFDNVKEIGDEAFNKCDTLLNIYSYGIVPPTVSLSYNSFSNYNATLRVPCNAVSNYKNNKTRWNTFNVQGDIMMGNVRTDAKDGEVTGAGRYEDGTIVILTATPNTGYHFVRWNDGDVDNPRTITATSDTIMYVAEFSIDQYTISTMANKASYGKVLGAGKYDYGSSVTLTATPNEHYHFVRWSDGSTDNPRTIKVTTNATYTAEFAIDQHTLAVTSADSQMGSVSGGGTYDYGTSATLQARPTSGYEFDKWNDNNTDNPRIITVTENKTFVATFKAMTAVEDVYQSTSKTEKLFIDGHLYILRDGKTYTAQGAMVDGW